jgi:murein L,D-transpeptidase YcbB/YkuD
MKPIHMIALALLCATLPGLPASAADKETTETAMLSAEPLSTDLLRIQMFGAVVDTAKPDVKKEAAPVSLRTNAPVANKPALREPDAAPKGAARKIAAPKAAAPKPEMRRADTPRIASPAISADPLQHAVQRRLSDGASATASPKAGEKAALVKYYDELGRPLLWVDEKGLTARGKAVTSEIARAGDYGLDASDYKLPDLSGFDRTAPDATATLAIAELEISRTVLAYARDARGGRIDPRRISRNLDPTLALPKPDEVIQSIAYRPDAGAYLRSFQPQHPQFEALRKKLRALRGDGTDRENAEPKIQLSGGPLLRLGDTDPQVALLRRRLDVPQGDNPERYDDALAEAVKRFQREHNTTADGVVGPGTRRLLNKPHLRNAGSPADIRKILLNMERWRWLPQDQGQFYVTVNVPEFMLRVVKDDETIHTTRVVVGKARTPTPVFSNDMKSVVFGPYWNVPNSIKTGEIRPYIRPYGGGWYGRRWDTRVLEQHELRIKYNGQHVDPQTIDWARADVRKLHFYQPPSPKNVLGRVKFVFPNKHDVYMHDTQEKHFFKRSVRAESHGCMRVQNPDDVAAIILKHDQNWSAQKTQTAFNTGYDKRVSLKTAVPVYITYFTLWVNEDGSIKTYRDLYGHDRRMTTALLRNGRNYAATKRLEAAPTRERQAARTRHDSGTRFARNAY